MAVYLVTGTNRGIGLEFVGQLLARGEQVIATCRDVDKAADLMKLDERHTNLEVLELDVTKADSLTNLPKRLADHTIDVFINNAGVYGPRDANFGNVNGDDWGQTLHINAVAPILLTQLLLPLLSASKLKKLVYITSKMGSVEDNSGGGQYIYRSSKAALNSAVKSLSIDLADGVAEVLRALAYTIEFFTAWHIGFALRCAKHREFPRFSVQHRHFRIDAHIAAATRPTRHNNRLLARPANLGAFLLFVLVCHIVNSSCSIAGRKAKGYCASSLRISAATSV